MSESKLTWNLIFVFLKGSVLIWKFKTFGFTVSQLTLALSILKHEDFDFYHMKVNGFICWHPFRMITAVLIAGGRGKYGSLPIKMPQSEFISSVFRERLRTSKVFSFGTPSPMLHWTES